MAPGRKLPPPDAVRLLGTDGTHLWIDGAPLQGALKNEAPHYALTAYSPYARTFDGLSPLLGPSPRFHAAAFFGNTAYLATELDGVWKIGPAPRTVEKLTPDAGLPSLKVGALAAHAGGVAVAAAPPETGLARLDFASGAWIALVPPPAALPSPVPSSTSARPLLAGSGRWILHVHAQPALYDTTAGSWSDDLVRYQSTRAAAIRPHPIPPREWSLTHAAAVVGDSDGFWLGGRYGLVQLRPGQAATAHVVTCPPVIALADAGPWLWVAFVGPDTREWFDDFDRPLDPPAATRSSRSTLMIASAR